MTPDLSTFSGDNSGYTGCIRPGKDTKNILHPFSSYAEHWVVGFVYQRDSSTDSANLYPVQQLSQVPSPVTDVHYFVQEKWRIASDKPGSGNTSNIGRMDGALRVFEAGDGVFDSEAEFLAYWRNYAPNGPRAYRDLAGFRAWCRTHSPAEVPAAVLTRARTVPHQIGLF